MLRPSEPRHPLTGADIDFMRTVTQRFYDQQRAHMPIRRSKNKTTNYDIIYQAFHAGLKQLLYYPNHSSTWDIGDILAGMSNIDRITLLKMRPALIPDCYDLVLILNHYIPVEDKLLFALSQADKIIDADLDVRKDNVLLVTNALPTAARLKFYNFMTKKLFAAEDKISAAADDTHTIPSHAISFSISFIAGALGVLNEMTGLMPSFRTAALLLAIGSAINGIYDLRRETPAPRRNYHPSTLWAHPRPASNTAANATEPVIIKKPVFTP